MPGGEIKVAETPRFDKAVVNHNDNTNWRPIKSGNSTVKFTSAIICPAIILAPLINIKNASLYVAWRTLRARAASLQCMTLFTPLRSWLKGWGTSEAKQCPELHDQLIAPRMGLRAHKIRLDLMDRLVNSIIKTSCKSLTSEKKEKSDVNYDSKFNTGPVLPTSSQYLPQLEEKFLPTTLNRGFRPTSNRKRRCY